MPRDIVVVGASAGGLDALCALFANLSPRLEATLFLVLHIPEEGSSLLDVVLSRAGPIRVEWARDRMAVEPGRAFIAPKGKHLLLEPGRMRVLGGPKENGHRPAVDTLFRSAARAYGRRAIGVVLSGSLDDGVAGLREIKASGGLALVQDPAEAAFDGMPRNAILSVDVDEVLPVLKLSRAIVEEARGPRGVEAMVRTQNERAVEGIEELDLEGERTPFTCPECGGPIWSVHEAGLERFRCHVGHAFSTSSFAAMHSDAVEAALWTAVRILEEQSVLLSRLAERATTRGQQRTAARFMGNMQDARSKSDAIREVVLSLSPAPAEGVSEEHSA